MTAVARSWLFCPGHRADLFEKAFAAGSDEVVLDLEDGVPDELKFDARLAVRRVLERHQCWIRINAPCSDQAAADLDALAELAAGIRVPKVSSAEDVAWVAERALGRPLGCTIETARGVLAAREVAAVSGVDHLIFGAADLAADLTVEVAPEPLLLARSNLVLASRAAGIASPIDGAYVGPDGDGLLAAAVHARSLGFAGKSAVRPHQVAVINDVFSPNDRQLQWARDVLEAFRASGGAPTRLASGELVDLPIAARAERLLELGQR